MSMLFERCKPVISSYINNAFKEGKLIKESVVAKNATTTQEGKIYQVGFYNEDCLAD
ncbi:MAG: hypothetical protein QM499_07150 [Flavobacteriaceae bacterium]